MDDFPDDLPTTILFRPRNTVNVCQADRQSVIEAFPKAPGPPKNKDAYLRFVDGIYQHDAYHSLSIEGYSVTPALIERVRQGDWDPDHRDDDRKNRDALAARGYWQAFQLVKGTVAEVIGGANPARASERLTGIGTASCSSPVLRWV